MKFLFVVESIQVSEGGPPQIFAALVNSLLRDYGDEVTVVCRRPRSIAVEFYEGVVLQYLPDGNWNPFLWIWAAVRLRRLIKSHDATFVGGIWGPYDGLALRLAGTRIGRVCIVAFGMLQPYILKRNAWKKWLGWNSYVRHNLLHASQVVVNSRTEAEQVESCGIPSERISIVPIGVDFDSIPEMSTALARQMWKIEEAARVVLYLGRIHPKKGLDLLIPAFARLHQSDSRWRMVIAGECSDSEYGAKINDLIEEFALTECVSLVGAVHGKLKWHLYKSADLFVLPSHSEGFSMAVLEAMAVGCPPLVTMGCNFPEIESDAGGWLAEASIESLTSVLDRIQSDFGSLHSRGAKAKVYVEGYYSVRYIAEQYRRLARK